MSLCCVFMAVSFIPSSSCELLAMPTAEMTVLTRRALRSLSSLATKVHRTDHVTEILFPIPLYAYYPAGLHGVWFALSCDPVVFAA